MKIELNGLIYEKKNSLLINITKTDKEGGYTILREQIPILIEFLKYCQK